MNIIAEDPLEYEFTEEIEVGIGVAGVKEGDPADNYEDIAEEGDEEGKEDEEEDGAEEEDEDEEAWENVNEDSGGQHEDAGNENSQPTTEGGSANSQEGFITFNSMNDILGFDMKSITVDDVDKYAFAERAVAYQFYCWFGRMNGFSVRKGQVLRCKAGEIVQQTFLCSRQGYREDRPMRLGVGMRLCFMFI